MKTVHTFCIYGLYPAILSFRIPNPPVPAVPKAVHTASKTGIFPNRRNRKLMNVSTMYMTYKILAVVRIFGTSLFTFGPGLSARSRCMVYPLPLSPFGESARRNTSTPMPPSQWLKLRQYIIPGESASTSPKIEEPVVVNPDTISNRASTKFGISLEKTNGRHPKKLIAIQLPATQTIPSLAKNLRVEFLQK